MAILQGERVVLPRLLDLVRDVQAIAGGSNPTFLMGTDVTEAFHQVPLHPSEQAYTVASVAGVFYVFRVLVFGSGSAPTVWGRYGAFLGRSTAAILGRDPVRLQVYVDDPIYAATGRPPEAARFLAVALLWARVAGFPLSWKKTECGKSLRWIGAQVCNGRGRRYNGLDPRGQRAGAGHRHTFASRFECVRGSQAEIVRGTRLVLCGPHPVPATVPVRYLGGVAAPLGRRPQ